MEFFLALMIAVVWLPLLVSQEQQETLVLTGQTAGSSKGRDTTTMDGRSNHRMLKKRRKRQHVNIDQLLLEFIDGTTTNPVEQQVASATEGTAVPLPMMTSGQALTPTPLMSLTQLLSQPTQISSFDTSKVDPTPAPLTTGALSSSLGAYTTTTSSPIVLTPEPTSVPSVKPTVPITAAYPPEDSARNTYSPYVSPMTSTSRPIITGQPVTTMPWDSINNNPISQQSSVAPLIMPPTKSLGGTLGTTLGTIKPIVTTNPTSLYYYYYSTLAPVPITSSPTYYPTLIPTPSPTYSPTLIPTPLPIHRPTLAPVPPPKSDAPTYYPTATAIPTPS
jgi:hypothetical protein